MIKKLVLFDIDGTLLHGGGSGRVATERAMLEVFGTAGKLASYRFDGKTDRYTMIHLLGEEGYNRDVVEARLADYEDAMVRHLLAIINQFPFQVLPGALELVTRVRDQPDLLPGLITGNMRQTAAIKLRHAGFDPDVFVVKVHGSEGFARRDLAPLALERAIAYCGGPLAPRDVVMIGDTPDDIDCARSIGARVITLATGSFSRAQLEDYAPDAIFEDLTNSEAVLRTILAL
ncbi:MAG TPA: HAD family hydrolase [Aggregatilineales bacterium]|nr:HAD family hydrolase [Aggregatilineales bacterium]